MKQNNRPATFGGAQFEYRTQDWSSDLGSLWKDWTVSQDGGTLSAIMLAKPADVYEQIQDIDAALLLEKPNITELQKQFQQLVEVYQQNNITVHTCSHVHATANWIFQRDLYCATPTGIILGRPASKVRRGEERTMLEILAAQQAPIIHVVHGDAFFEGADLLWINEKKALFGVGNRSNLAALAQLQMLFPQTEFFVLTLPSTIQHLLGLVNFVSTNTIGLWSAQCTPENRAVLQSAGLQIIDVLDEQEIIAKRAFNWVCLRPNCVLLPADAPNTRTLLTEHGIETRTANIDAYRKCGGGLGCLTGILNRI